MVEEIISDRHISLLEVFSAIIKVYMENPIKNRYKTK